jgi:hypothetical protein
VWLVKRPSRGATSSHSGHELIPSRVRVSRFKRVVTCPIHPVSSITVDSANPHSAPHIISVVFLSRSLFLSGRLPGEIRPWGKPQVMREILFAPRISQEVGNG